MEDGNIESIKEDKHGQALTNLYKELPARITSNGHDFPTDSALPRDDHVKPKFDQPQEDKYRKRINPLKIHLGKRPFVDNSISHHNPVKRKATFTNRATDDSHVAKTPVPRVVPRLIPKKVNRNQLHNISSHSITNNAADNEESKPVPRLVPKSQLSQYKKSKAEKNPQLKEYTQYLGLQPMVKFKCRKCCSMFKTLVLLREHQQICRAQAREPTLSPEAAPSTEQASNSGPSRVTRKVYLCSACGTYYENWNLFLHMREVHNRHICLFCLGMFSKAEKLSAHLTNKHNVNEYSYDNKEDFFNVYNGTLYLMCCSCDEICSEQDDFFNHDCNNIKPKPVPVLVSKNAVKSNSVKQINKNNNEVTANGPTVSKKDVNQPAIETSKLDYRKEISEIKNDIITPAKTQSSTDFDTSTSSENVTNISKDSNSSCNISEVKPDLDSSETNSNHSIHTETPIISVQEKDLLANGEENVQSESIYNQNIPTPMGEVFQGSPEHNPTLSKVEECHSIDKEKECGIKLKLSLNNANSPVIINSTVDPTVGRQNPNKPPSRIRRPPKRYEKETPPELYSPQPATPTIKIKICDKADSPFVRTTIIENKQDNTTKLIINNNFDSTFKSPDRPENIIKTTIYDNKPEEINNLNRVPKLTVRVPKELLDRDSSSDYSSDSDVSDKLTVDEKSTSNNQMEQTIESELESQPLQPVEDVKIDRSPILQDIVADIEPQEKIDDKNETLIERTTPMDETENETSQTELTPTEKSEESNINDEIPITELTLNKPLDKYPLKDLLKVFLASTVSTCIYCNHVRKIAVNCEQLSLHMVAEHRFTATVDSITAEELLPETITTKVKAGAEEVRSVFINLDYYDSVDKYDEIIYDQIFECFQCYFKTAVHKDLYLHNRKMHQKTMLLCVMCKINFYSYSELLCHLCPGTYDPEYVIRFRCYLCNIDSIPSSFRLMVHLRKIHHTCDVCLENCQNQSKLSNHVWKHKLHHLCYRCGIAYRNKPDITKHLFWKHGTESVMCKKCLQKKWPHVYHFCTPPATFICDECSLTFTRAVYLKVHKRFHSEEYPHVCHEEGCSEKFVSKKLLLKHIELHKNPPEEIKEQNITIDESLKEESKDVIPVIDLVDEKPKEETEATKDKPENEPEPLSKKSKKKKMKDRDLLLDVNLPALNLSESDSSDDSDSGLPSNIKNEPHEIKTEEGKGNEEIPKDNGESTNVDTTLLDKTEECKPDIAVEEKPNEQQVLDIWDNFKKYQAKVEKQKTPPLVPIRKHVCESDHDYCIIPTDLNGEDDLMSPSKKNKKKLPKKRHGDLTSSSSSSSDSDSSCSCGSNCSCSSSSGSSSSSSSDSDSSDSGQEVPKKKKQLKKTLPNRRTSCGSQMSAVDVMGIAETPLLIPEKLEPPIAETDLETEESETDEEFYDEYPQKLANKILAEKRNQLLLLASVAPSDNGSMSGEVSRSTTPIKEEEPLKEEPRENLEESKPVIKEKSVKKEKPSSSKKKSKKKKKSKSSRKTQPIKINIPKEIIAKAEPEVPLSSPLIPNKITISLQSNTVQLPELHIPPPPHPSSTSTPITAADKKRASKRRRVPNRFYGYSSDEESSFVRTPHTPQLIALKPQQPPKLEWRKEDLPSPVTHKTKKEVPSSTITNRLYNYNEPIRLSTPIPDPEPPRILMNSESMESSESESSNEGALEIYQPNVSSNSIPEPPPHLNSGTSSLPYVFQRPAVRQAREGESVYCYCRCPYDEVSEMIACDAEGCTIEWFHFECVGIMVPPKGKWYCPECRKKQSYSAYR